MKLSTCLTALTLLTAAPAFADQTVGEAAKDTGHDAKRKVKKTGHKVDEALCTGTDAECAAKKAKHRVKETGESAGDKVEETTDKVD